ncbi:MAG TPA: MFS transporter [Nocardioidaceae bacterium]|nr:MFS transporter [Nocardioidaceae bacterium]
MFTPYRRVLALPGALAFSMSGLVARLPISMVSLGIVLLVSTRSGSYSLAGAVSASYLIANAVFAVLQARLTDRLGQSRVLPATILVFAVALALMMWAVEADWPMPVPHVFAALAGAALPQVGSSVRARWSHLTADNRDLQTAFAFEAVVDEAVFMLGPTIVTLLATTVHPLAGLVAAVVSGLAGTLALAAQRRTEPVPHRTPHAVHATTALGWAVLGPLVVASFGMGILFGAAEVATVAFSEELGAKAAAGPLLAVFALGSLLSGFITGAVSWRAPVQTRFRRGTLALALAMVPLPFVHGFVLMGTLLFLAGFAISPTLIASVSWVEETVPPNRLTEGISILTTGLAAGVAPGAAFAGIVVDHRGAFASFWVPVAAGFLATTVAFGTAFVSGRRPVPTAADQPAAERLEQVEAGRVDQRVPGVVDPVDHEDHEDHAADPGPS